MVQSTQIPQTPARATNSLAITSFVLSLCGACLFLPVLGQILGLVFGFIGLKQTKERGEDGRGLALAGILISAISLLIGIMIVSLIIIFAIASDTSRGYYST